VNEAEVDHVAAKVRATRDARPSRIVRTHDFVG
jgi:hypothetical protein